MASLMESIAPHHLDVQRLDIRITLARGLRRIPCLRVKYLLPLVLAPLMSMAEAASDSVPPHAAPADATDPAAAATALIRRVLPEHVDRFRCEVIPADSGRDVFEIERVDERIVLRGNQGTSLAMGFNWYLRTVCLTNFDWEASAPLKLTAPPGFPADKTRRICAAPERFALNYCTYGYTFPWWSWDQWQRFVDWMAMNGVNRPLLQCGQEAAWFQVWQSYGMSADEVRAFFVGPAHLPWQRMANLDQWGGPLPLSYIEGQRDLQVRILGRARGLGMKPILSAFAGHLPQAMAKLRPQARITRIEPGWGGTDAQYATWFLDPTDPLFQDIQLRFLKEQERLYGTDHLYSADPFNEIAPPSWEPAYLGGVSRKIHESIDAVDPKSVWYLMSWNFFFDKKWTPPRLEALTVSVPAGRMAYLDYVCEQAEFFRQTDNFHGAPFVWCYVGNFGGNTHFVAPLKLISDRSSAALPVANCLGIGTTLEGLNINPVAYDLLFEQPWHQGAKIDVDSWLDRYADRRAGRIDPAVRKAWRTLGSEIFTSDPDGLWGRHNLLQTVPNPGAAGKVSVPEKQVSLVAAIDSLLAADSACRRADGYQYDLVNLSRQALGNATYIVGKRLLAAVSRKDLPAFRAEASRLMELGADIDTLLGTRHEWLLGRWIADARGWADKPGEADYYEHNAREIITTWHKPGGGLDDYARRQWNGLFRTYYMDRWREFIARMDRSLETGAAFDTAAYQKWRIEGDGRWVNSTKNDFLTHPEGDPFETAARLIAKYRNDLVVPVETESPALEMQLASPAWSSASFAGEGRHRWTLDASAFIRDAGIHLVTFRFREGDSALEVRKVAILQDGRELAADTHDGWAGHEHKNHIYRMEMKDYRPGKPVILVMEVEAASSNQTAGDIVIRRAE